MSRPRAARPSSAPTGTQPVPAHTRALASDRAHQWRVRAGALGVITLAVAIPLAASAAAQPLVKGRTDVPAAEVAVHTSTSASRIPTAVLRPRKAKAATPVTTTPPKPKPAPKPKPVVTAPPTTQYIPPPTAPPTTRYIPPPTAPPTTRYIPPPTAPPVQYSQGSGRCGGSLPPCYVMQRESGGSLTARNPSSTASGKWQFLNGTWNGYGGYPTAASAPEAVQDARAAQVWAGGAGCSNWSAC